jgi:hypothetical protein
LQKTFPPFEFGCFRENDIILEIISATHFIDQKIKSRGMAHSQLLAESGGEEELPYPLAGTCSNTWVLASPQLSK